MPVHAASHQLKENYSPEQLKAIQKLNGPVLVVAGPGAGKTRVLTGRLLYMTEEKRIPADSILLLTFTRAAAAEMRDRYLRRRKNTRKEPLFGTFHSVFFQILQKYVPGRYSLIRKEEALQLLHECCEKHLPDDHFSRDALELILGDFSRLKNGLPPRYSFSAQLLEKYDAEMTDRGLLDYDDMLLRFARLIMQNGRVLEELQQRFRYLMIDEFQDLNSLQFDIIRMLAEKHRNVFAVGDDDQSIYGFRGSRPAVMQEFKAVYPDAAVCMLSVNYRSSGRIVKAASALIGHNRERIPKKLRAAAGKGISIRLAGYKGAEEEANAVAAYLRLLSKKMQKPGALSAGILYRTHQCSLQLRRTLMREGIPWTESGEKRDIPADAPYPRITLSSFHGAKGLEFDIVIIIRADQRITPGRNAEGPALEEERRAFYVAVTRASSVLHILFTKDTYNQIDKRSVFVKEISGERHGSAGYFDRRR